VLLGADQLNEVGRLFAALCRHGLNNLKYSDEKFAERVSSILTGRKIRSKSPRNSALLGRCYTLTTQEVSAK
jgi:hypothetical protein